MKQSTHGEKIFQVKFTMFCDFQLTFASSNGTIHSYSMHFLIPYKSTSQGTWVERTIDSKGILTLAS